MHFSSSNNLCDSMVVVYNAGNVRVIIRVDQKWCIVFANIIYKYVIIIIAQ